MLEEGRINGRQVFFIMFWVIMATAILFLHMITSRYAPRDSWMDAVLFITNGGFIAWIAAKLGAMFPKQTIVEYTDLILGPWLGKVVSAILILWVFQTGSMVYREVASFFVVAMLPDAPLTFIMLLISLAPAYAVYHGLEVIGRSSDFLFFIALGLIILIHLLLIPEYDFTKLLPVFGDGIGNILRGSLAVTAYAGEIILVLFFFPYIKDNQKAGKIMLSTIVAIGIGGILTELAYTAIFGLEFPFLNLPFYHMSRYATIGRFVERLDPFFMIANFLGNYLKLSIFTYVIVLGLAQLLKMKNYRKLIIPVILALNIVGLYSFRSMMEVIDFTDKIWPFYTLPIQIGIPLLLISVAKFRGLGCKVKK
ncbi:MAG: endospore germination permease [Desulfitobacteriaceae bacterium]